MLFIIHHVSPRPVYIKQNVARWRIANTHSGERCYLGTPLVCVCTLVSLNLVMRRPSLCCVLVVHVVATHRKSATLLGVQFELYFCQSTERRELPLHHRSLIVICRRLVKRCRNISRLVYIIHLAPFITIYRYRYRENGSEIIARKILCLSLLSSSPPFVTDRVTSLSLGLCFNYATSPGISASNWTLNSFYFRPNESGEKGLKRFIIRESWRGQTLLPQSGERESFAATAAHLVSFLPFLPPPFRP